MRAADQLRAAARDHHRRAAVRGRRRAASPSPRARPAPASRTARRRARALAARARPSRSSASARSMLSPPSRMWSPTATRSSCRSPSRFAHGDQREVAGAAADVDDQDHVADLHLLAEAAARAGDPAVERGLRLLEQHRLGQAREPRGLGRQLARGRIERRRHRDRHELLARAARPACSWSQARAQVLEVAHRGLERRDLAHLGRRTRAAGSARADRRPDGTASSSRSTPGATRSCCRARAPPRRPRDRVGCPGHGKRQRARLAARSGAAGTGTTASSGRASTWPGAITCGTACCAERDLFAAAARELHARDRAVRRAQVDADRVRSRRSKLHLRRRDHAHVVTVAELAAARSRSRASRRASARREMAPVLRPRPTSRTSLAENPAGTRDRRALGLGADALERTCAVSTERTLIVHDARRRADLRVAVTAHVFHQEVHEPAFALQQAEQLQGRLGRRHVQLGRGLRLRFGASPSPLGSCLHALANTALPSTRKNTRTRARGARNYGGGVVADVVDAGIDTPYASWSRARGLGCVAGPGL